MSKRDYYEVLGIERGAGEAEIKKAYHKSAIKYHPDKNPGDATAEKKFKEVSEAYQILSDSQRKAAYDRFGHEGVQGGGYSGGADFDPMEIFRNFASQGGFGDFFSSFMGGGFEGRGGTGINRRGEDLRVSISMTLEEIARGAEKKLRIRRKLRCEDCSGSGAGPSGRSVQCSQCNGTGEVKVVQRALWGQVVQRMPCSRCDGEGTIIEDPCPHCRGDGRVDQQEEVVLNIPAGVGDGQTLLKRGGGNVGRRGAHPGDLLITIKEKPHDIFERQGEDLLLKLPISMVQAALGAKIQIPTLDGKVEIKIPAGIQSGKVLRLRDRGLGTGRMTGDLYVEIHVWTPQKIGSKEKTLFRQLGSLPGMQPPKPGKGFFERVKDAFRG